MVTRKQFLNLSAKSEKSSEFMSSVDEVSEEEKYIIVENIDQVHQLQDDADQMMGLDFETGTVSDSEPDLVKMIEEQEPNKLKAEIYRLRYEH